MTTLPDGVFAASLTPQREDLSVDFQRLSAHCRWLLASGCDGIAPLGSTGEANSFSVPERLEIVEHLLTEGLPPHRMLIGTGCCALPDTVALTKHAVEHGAGGVLLLPPFYYKGVSDEGLHAFIERVIQGVADSRLRIYLYHFPRMTGVPFSHALLERLLTDYPGTVVGMKDSSGEWEHMQSICANFPGFKIYAGSEKFLLDILEAGGAGCISATTNVTGAIAGSVYRTWQSGGARRTQEHLTAVRLAFQKLPFVPALKRLIAEHLDCPAWEHLRPPFAPLDDASFSTLRQELQALGFTLTMENLA